MKKQLLFAGLLFGSFFSLNAQQLQAENFNALTIGNIGTDLTGATPGQGGFYTGNAAGGTNSNNSNYQVVAGDATHGNTMQIVGSNAATGNRFLWKGGLETVWATRTAGNDIIEVEFDYYTGANNTSANSFRVYVYSDEETPRVLAGIGITKRATISSVVYTNVVQGFTTWTSTPGTGTYSFGLGPSTTEPQVTLPENTWVRLGFSFNKGTGEVIWKGPGIAAAFSGNDTFPATTTGADAGELDFIVIAGTGNTIPTTFVFDNYISRASNTDTLLSNDDFSVTSKFSVYPNPSNGLVNISSDLNSSLNSVSITDLNGRTVKTVELNGDSSAQVNISDLSAGVYMMNINSDQGSTTKKIIKN